MTTFKDMIALTIPLIEANIRGGGKTVHVFFKYLSRSLLYKGGGGEKRLPPPPPPNFAADSWIFNLKTT
jgi:hypothetical protein